MTEAGDQRSEPQNCRKSENKKVRPWSVVGKQNARATDPQRTELGGRRSDGKDKK